jgi:WD40 repeat protein
VKDAHRFFIHSKNVIESYPLQTYASALLFSPSGSLIRTAFQHEAPNWVTIEPEISETWGSCLHTFEEKCRAVAFSHDSNHLALGLRDGTIKIWDADSSAYLRRFENQKTGFVLNKVRFFHDSARLATISTSNGGDKMIRLWDIATGTCLSTGKHDAKIFRRVIPFCKVGALKAFAKATIGDSVRIFDTAEARELSILTSPHHDTTGELKSTFSPSGRLLAVNFKTNIKIWDAISNRHTQSLELPVRNKDSNPSFVTSVWVSDSALLAVRLNDGMVIVFSVDSGDVLHILQSRAESGYESVSTVALSDDSRKVASSSGRSSIRIWDLSDTSNPQTLATEDVGIRSVAFSPDSERLVSRSIFGETKIWDIRSEDFPQRLGDHQASISSLAWSNDSTYLASGALDSTVKTWDLHGRCLQTLHGHSDSIKRVDFFYHPARVASLSYDATYRIWDVASGQLLHVHDCGVSHTGAEVALSPDLRILACTKGDSTTGNWPIQLWDVIDDVSLPTLGGDSAARIRSFTFSGDATKLAVLVNNNTVKIYHTESGECIQTVDAGYETSDGRYRPITFSNDATRLASAWDDGTIRVWDINSGRCLHTIGNCRIADLSFDQSGQFLLTDHGRIAIPVPPDLEGCVAPTTTRPPVFHGLGLSLDRKWITYNSVNVLWLPPGYRPHRSVISGNSVGVAAGRKLWIFTISPEYF